MQTHSIELLIEKADNAINREDFATLTEIYSDEAILVVKPGMNASGKAQIRKPFEAIAAHFKHTLHVEQVGMKILESGDTALVLARTVVSADGVPPTTRNATYVFKKDKNGNWHCTIDNSYGHDLLLHDNA